MTDQAAEPGLIRSIGVWGLAALVLNGIIGAGIFALPGSVAHHSGAFAPLVVLGVGVALLPIVIVFARLSGMFEDTGGPILYVQAAFSPVAAFQIGWMQYLATTAASAANANLLADYLLRLAPPEWSGTAMHAAIVLTAIALALAINLLEARHSAIWIKRISIGKLLPLLLLLALALASVGAGGPGLLPATDWSLPEAILLSVYAFTGFESALTIAGEARDPKRDFPRALVGVFALVVALYALIVWGYVASVYAPGVTDKAALVTMSAVLAGEAGTVVIVLAAVLSIFGNVTTNTLGVSRRLLALERIAALPAWFGVIRADSGLPRNAVLFTAGFIAILALSGGFAVLAVLSVAARLVVYLACTSALPVIRKRQGVRISFFECGIVVAAIATGVLLISQSEWQAWAGLALAIMAGFALKSAMLRSVASRSGSAKPG